MLYYIGRLIFFVLFKTLFGLKVYGKENIPKSGGFIIASNHESNLDPEIIGVSIPRVISFMAKEEFFRNKIFGWLLRRVNAFGIKREGADISSIKEAIKRLNHGYGLLLFPQGGRRSLVSSDEIKGGVGFLACKADVKVVPAFILGSGDVLPKGKRIPALKMISVFFAPPMAYRDYKGYADFSSAVMSAIEALGRASGVN